MPTAQCTEVDAQIYDFLGRYRKAIHSDAPMLNEDIPIFKSLVATCQTQIPSNLHAQIWTDTCFFAVMKKKDKSFCFHIAFRSDNIEFKYRLDAPRSSSCTLYKLDAAELPSDIKISTVKMHDDKKNDTSREEWCIVDSKKLDRKLMPPPPPVPRVPR